MAGITVRPDKGGFTRPLPYQKQGRVACITLNRPQAFNSIDPETWQELGDALVDFRDDSGLLADELVSHRSV